MSEERLSPAAELFAEYLAAAEQNPTEDFERWCAAHPAHAEALRRMHAKWQRLEAAMPDVARGQADEVAAAGSIPSGPDAPAGTLPPARPCPADKYRAAEVIGRGGMGLVERVWDGDLRRWVARKVLAGADGHGRPGPRALSRFLDEAQLTARLDHPGIVAVHELGVDPAGRVYFTMAWVRGQSLRELMPQIRSATDGWSLPRVLQVLLRVCEAIAFAHERGVVHRDLKPANVMVGPLGETYVVDWGLARAVDQSEPGQPADPGLDQDTDPAPALELGRTLDGDVVGTVPYMAPEQARGERDAIGAGVDIYALGAILYEILGGRAPFGEDPTSDAPYDSTRALAALRAGPPPPLDPQAGPPELVAICERAMQRDPRERYATVAELAGDLRAFLELRVVSAYRTGALVELRKWILRNRLVATVAAAAVVFMLGASLFIWDARAEAESQAATAKTGLAKAQDAIDRMLTQVGVHSLRKIPEARAIQRALLEDAVELQVALLAERPDDPEAQMRVGYARTRAAVLASEFGDTERATELFATGFQELDQLSRTAGQSTDVWYRLLNCAALYANFVERMGEAAKAIEITRSVLDREPPPIVDAQTAREIAMRTAGVWSALGAAHRTRHEHELAVEARARAVACWSEALAGPNTELTWRLSALSARLDHGASLMKTGVEEGVVDTFVTGHREAVALHADHPDEPAAVRALIRAARSAGFVLSVRSRSADALEIVDSAMDVARGYAEAYAATPLPWHELALMLIARGQALDLSGRPVEAVDAFVEALAASTTSRRLDPKQVSFETWNVNAARGLADLGLKLGLHDRVLEACAALETVERGEISQRIASRRYGFLIGKLRADTSLSPERRDELVQFATDRCVATLRAAVDRGFANAANLESGAWDTVRDRQDFQQIEASLSR